MASVGYKLCRACFQHRPKDRFDAEPSRACGRSSRCRECAANPPAPEEVRRAREAWNLYQSRWRKRPGKVSGECYVASGASSPEADRLAGYYAEAYERALERVRRREITERHPEHVEALRAMEILARDDGMIVACGHVYRWDRTAGRLDRREFVPPNINPREVVPASPIRIFREPRFDPQPGTIARAI